jgi:hypothetical protein
MSLDRCERQNRFKEAFDKVHTYPIEQFLPITVNGETYMPRIKEKHNNYMVIEYTVPNTVEYSHRYHVLLSNDEIKKGTTHGKVK